MTITSVNSSTFLADAIILIRDKLRSNITDPIVSSRPSTQSFVYTSYPQKGVTYPIITVVDRGVAQTRKLGMGSEGTLISLTLEVRIWARNIKERDELFDKVYDYLRNNQLDTGGLVEAQLFDFTLTSAVNISEPGEQGVKSKVCEIKFLFVCN